MRVGRAAVYWVHELLIAPNAQAAGNPTPMRYNLLPCNSPTL